MKITIFLIISFILNLLGVGISYDCEGAEPFGLMASNNNLLGYSSVQDSLQHSLRSFGDMNVMVKGLYPNIYVNSGSFKYPKPFSEDYIVQDEYGGTPTITEVEIKNNKLKLTLLYEVDLVSPWGDQPKKKPCFNRHFISYLYEADTEKIYRYEKDEISEHEYDSINGLPDIEGEVTDITSENAADYIETIDSMFRAVVEAIDITNDQDTKKDLKRIKNFIYRLIPDQIIMSKEFNIETIVKRVNKVIPDKYTAMVSNINAVSISPDEAARLRIECMANQIYVEYSYSRDILPVPDDDYTMNEWKRRENVLFNNVRNKVKDYFLKHNLSNDYTQQEIEKQFSALRNTDIINKEEKVIENQGKLYPHLLYKFLYANKKKELPIRYGIFDMEQRIPDIGLYSLYRLIRKRVYSEE